MLSRNDLAKELIRRRDHPASRSRHPPPPSTLPEALAGNATTTSSYEMVDQPAHEAGPLGGQEQDGQRQRFWRIRRRAQAQDEQDGGVERRVVSHVDSADTRKPRKVLDRLRLRRASEVGHQVGRDGNVTIVTETDSSSSQEGETSAGPHISTHISDTSVPSNPGVARGHGSVDNSPSFISFSPASASHRFTPVSTSRSTPHSTHSQTGGASRRTLAPALTTPNPPQSPNRGAAVRAISLEARLADTSLGSAPDVECSEEYPSLIDSSTDGLRGILRPKNARAPPNTPTPTVRFADSWLTGIKSPISKLKSKVLERRTELELDRADTLPPAQISGGARWKRLGVLLGAVDRTPATDESSPEVPTVTPLRGSKSLSSDSPISFARFDRDDPLSHSTPVRKYEHKQRRPNASSTLQAAQHTSTPDTSSADTASTPSSSSIPARPRMWSRRWSDEEVIIEPCSAIEALWEYGSSDSDREDGENQDATATDDSPGGPIKTTVPLATYDIDPLTPAAHADPVLVTPPTMTPATAPPRRPTLQDRRESGELIPLKYRGGSFDAAAQSDPFPFATALKF